MEACHHHSCCNGNHKEENTCHGCCCQKNLIELSSKEKSFLEVLAKTPFLPIVSFVAKSSKSNHLENIMLSPVYLENCEDTLEIVKERSSILNNLETIGAISIDYDIEIENADYSIYANSNIYNYFEKTIYESKNNPNFIFDTPHMECGSIALTGIGQSLIYED